MTGDMGLALPFRAGCWRKLMRAHGDDRAATTSVVGGTEHWWGVGIEPSGYDVRVLSGGIFGVAALCSSNPSN